MTIPSVGKAAPAPRKSAVRETRSFRKGGRLPAILRLVLGVVFFAHGAQKLLGWFGGPGFSGSMGLFTGYLHIPPRSPSSRSPPSFFDGLGLILGFLTRIAAFGIAMNMVIAIAEYCLSNVATTSWPDTQMGLRLYSTT